MWKVFPSTLTPPWKKNTTHKGSVHEEEEYEDMCVICLVNVPDAQMCPCGHSMICWYCTQELMIRSEPCPICRKEIVGFDVGVYSGSLGERGLWPTSARNFRELARNNSFNEYFQKQLNGNEATYLRWKEVRICEDESQRGANDDDGDVPLPLSLLARRMF